MRIKYDSKGIEDLHITVLFMIIYAISLPLSNNHFFPEFYIVSFSLFFPGYALVGILFPQGSSDYIWGRSEENISVPRGISSTERVFLSFMTSLLILPVGVLFFPPNIVISLSSNFNIALDTLIILNFSIVGIAYFRRLSISEQLRYRFTFDFEIGSAISKDTKTNITILILLFGLGFSSLSLVTFSSLEAKDSDLTEFYVLDSEGGLTLFPENASAEQEYIVIIGMANNNREDGNFTVKIDKLFFGNMNVTNLNPQTPIENFSGGTIDAGEILSGNGFEVEYSFFLNQTGLWRIEFILEYQIGLGSKIMQRSLNLWVSVI